MGIEVSSNMQQIQISSSWLALSFIMCSKHAAKSEKLSAIIAKKMLQLIAFRNTSTPIPVERHEKLFELWLTTSEIFVNHHWFAWWRTCAKFFLWLLQARSCKQQYIMSELLYTILTKRDVVLFCTCCGGVAIFPAQSNHVSKNNSSPLVKGTYEHSGPGIRVQADPPPRSAKMVTSVISEIVLGFICRFFLDSGSWWFCHSPESSLLFFRVMLTLVPLLLW